MKEKAFLSIVVYVYNAENTIESFLGAYHKFLEEHFENFELILVNDASTDRTVERIENSGYLTGNILLVDLSWHHRTELAIVAGSDLAMGDFVIGNRNFNCRLSDRILFSNYFKNAKVESM